MSSLDEETAAKVLRQVEFYFSDSNLPGDPFLLKSIQESEDGMVNLSLLCSFQRMRSHLGVKESDPSKFSAKIIASVAEVLRKSTSLHLSEDGTKVGRVSKLLDPEAVRAEVDARSIAANPFPYNITMDEVETFFSQHGQVKSVRLPRHATSKNAASGYAVVEFVSEEEAQKILKLELICQGATLTLEPKTTFDARKETLPEHGGNGRKAGNDQRQERQWNGRSGRGEEADDDYTKGLIVSFTVKKPEATHGANKEESAGGDDKKEESAGGDDKKEESAGGADKKEESAGGDDKKEESAGGDDKKEESAGGDDKKEESAGGDDKKEEKLSREDIKGALCKYGTVRYVDYLQGNPSGFVRFDQPEDAQKLRAAAIMAAEGGLSIAKCVVSFEALEGDAEKDYWKKLKQGQGQRRDFGGGGRGFNNRGRGRGGGGRRGGGRGGRGRGHSDRDHGRDSEGGHGKHKRFNEGQDGGNNAKNQKTE